MSLVRVSEELDEFELTKDMTEKWVQLQGNTTQFELGGVQVTGVLLYYTDLAKAKGEAPVDRFLIYFRQ